MFVCESINKWRLARLKRKLKVNSNPENAKPTSYYKSFYLETRKGDKTARFGYISDFYGTGEPGILVHGSSDGKITIVSEGIREANTDVPKRYYSPKEFYHYLIYRHSLDLAKDKRPLHLICCYSGAAKEGSKKLSIAQQLANITQRKIWAYGGHEMVCTRSGGLAEIIDNLGHIRNLNHEKLEPKLIEPHPPEYPRIKTSSSSRC